MINYDKGIIDTVKTAERILPFKMDSSNILRIGTFSANLPANTIEWFYVTQGGRPSISNSSHNSAGRFYFQPSMTAPGHVIDGNLLSIRALEILASVHYSPNVNCLPTLARGQDGVYYAVNGSYDNTSGTFLPYMVRNDNSKPPLHDVEITNYLGYNTSITHIPSTQDNTREWSQVSSTFFSISGAKRFILDCWFLCLVNGVLGLNSDGNMWPIQPIAHVLSSTWTPSTSKRMLINGNSSYYLIKTVRNYYLENGNFTIDGTGGSSLSWIGQPQLGVNLSFGSNLQVTSFGFDIYPNFRSG